MKSDNLTHFENFDSETVNDQTTPNDLTELREWVRSSDEMVSHKALNSSMKGEIKFFSRQITQYLRPIIVRTLWITLLFVLVGQLYYVYVVVPKQPVAAPMPLPIAVEQLGDDLAESPKPPKLP